MYGGDSEDCMLIQSGVPSIVLKEMTWGRLMTKEFDRHRRSQLNRTTSVDCTNAHCDLGDYYSRRDPTPHEIRDYALT
jgi:hypothetical protein